MKKIELIEKLKKEMEKSLLLEDADREYWLSNANTLPDLLLVSFYKFLKPKNDLVDLALEKALQADPEAVIKLKNKIAKVKKLYLQLQEKGETKPEDLDKQMEDHLKNL